MSSNPYVLFFEAVNVFKKKKTTKLEIIPLKPKRPTRNEFIFPVKGAKDNQMKLLRLPWNIAGANAVLVFSLRRFKIRDNEIHEAIIIRTPSSGFSGKLYPLRIRGKCQNPQIEPIIKARADSE